MRQWLTCGMMFSSSGGGAMRGGGGGGGSQPASSPYSDSGASMSLRSPKSLYPWNRRGEDGVKLCRPARRALALRHPPTSSSRTGRIQGGVPILPGGDCWKLGEKECASIDAGEPKEPWYEAWWGPLAPGGYSSMFMDMSRR